MLVCAAGVLLTGPPTPSAATCLQAVVMTWAAGLLRDAWLHSPAFHQASFCLSSGLISFILGSHNTRRAVACLTNATLRNLDPLELTACACRACAPCWLPCSKTWTQR